MKSMYSCLQKVKDHRRSQGKRTPMAAFLEMIVLAGMSGHFGYRPISRFITNNKEFFEARYNLAHGTPSYTTLRNFMKGLNYRDLCDALNSWIIQFLDKEGRLAIDGKRMNSTVENEDDSKQNYKSMVSLFCNKKGIVIKSLSIENKNKEGNAARDLIAQCELKGISFTMDALHCQKKLRKPSWSQEMYMYFK